MIEAAYNVVMPQDFVTTIQYPPVPGRASYRNQCSARKNRQKLKGGGTSLASSDLGCSMAPWL